MPSDETNQPVQLPVDQQSSAGATLNELARNIQVMKGLILQVMNHPQAAESGEETGEGVYYSGPHMLIVHGPEYCYVYDGVAMVCRPCTADEEAGLETMQSQ